MFSVLASLGYFECAPEKYLQRNGRVRGAEVCGKRERQAKMRVKIRVKQVENR
jgi:hypothetical protein